jgi:hypothetical protein
MPPRRKIADVSPEEPSKRLRASNEGGTVAAPTPANAADDLLHLPADPVANAEGVTHA